MQIKNEITIFQDIKKLAGFVGTNPFLLFTIGSTLIISTGLHQIIINLMSDQYGHIITVLVLIELGYFSAERTLTSYMKYNPSVFRHASSLIVFPMFIQLFVITELVYFEILIWSSFVPEISDPEAMEQSKTLLTQAQIFSLFNTGFFIILFYGNRIVKNIRKRDLIMEITH